MEFAKVVKIIVTVTDGKRHAEYDGNSDDYDDVITLPNCQAYTANVAIVSRKLVNNAQQLAEAIEAKLPEFQNFDRYTARNEINTIIQGL